MFFRHSNLSEASLKPVLLAIAGDEMRSLWLVGLIPRRLDSLSLFLRFRGRYRLGDRADFALYIREYRLKLVKSLLFLSTAFAELGYSNLEGLLSTLDSY